MRGLLFVYNFSVVLKVWLKLEKENKRRENEMLRLLHTKHFICSKVSRKAN